METKKYSVESICSELVDYTQKHIADASLKIDAQTTFNELGLDSSSIIELVLFIERKFSVSISEQDLIPENLKSIQTIANCTSKYL